jgi:hypothetical protein
MKPIHLALLALILILGIVNVLASLGIIGGGGKKSSGAWEYKILSAAEMDIVGFRAVAEDAGLTADEEGRIPLKDFPPEKVVTQAMMARTISEVETQGWEFVAVTSSTAVSTAQGESRSDRYFIFRKPK